MLSLETVFRKIFDEATEIIFKKETEQAPGFSHSPA